MQTQLATPPGRQSHPPQPVRTLEMQPVRRVGPLDRAAMHLGIALIRWGRRPVKVNIGERLGFNPETDEALRTMEQVRDEIRAMSMAGFR